MAGLGVVFTLAVGVPVDTVVGSLVVSLLGVVVIVVEVVFVVFVVVLVVVVVVVVVVWITDLEYRYKCYELVAL